MNCWQKKGFFRDLRMNVRWYLWGKMAQMCFNNQDAHFVAQTTKYVNRTGNWRYLTKLTPNDTFHTLWRQYCNEEARGVGSKWLAEHRPAARVAQPAIAGGSEGAGGQ